MKTMNNKIVIVIILFLTIYSLSMCKPHCNVVLKWEFPAAHLIRFNKSTSYEMNKNGVDLDINLDISSDVTDDAFLVLYAVKEYPPDVLEGFKDSLIIDGFHIRSYFIPNGYDATEVKTPVDYPVYIKKTTIKKGKKLENVKINFPKDIASIKGKVVISTGLVRYNDEIDRKIELRGLRNYTRKDGTSFAIREFYNYEKIFFETFPDSSNITLAFSHFDFLFGYSILANDEAPEISRENCKFHPPTYSNFDSYSIHLNH